MLQRARTLWRRILSGPPGREPEAVEERRVWVRRPSSADAVLRARGEESRLTARIRDASRGGISLVVGRSFEPGEVLEVEVPGGTDQSSSVVLACVVRVRPQPGGEWLLGCSFCAELSDRDLASFGAGRVRPPEDDPRDWLRFRCDVEATFELTADPTSPPCEARVVNISPRGVGLLVDRPVPAGALLSLELRGAGGDVRRSMLACAVHVTARPGPEWVVGCSFPRELSESDLQALL
jgi:hypothetical protein